MGGKYPNGQAHDRTDLRLLSDWVGPPGSRASVSPVMIYTVAQLAAELGMSRARVHQLIATLGLHPERLGSTGPFMLTGRDRRTLLDRKRGKPGRPKTKPV